MTCGTRYTQSCRHQGTRVGRTAVGYYRVDEWSRGDARTLTLAAKHQLTARRVHDAQHAATALVAGITLVYTYDVADWQVFEAAGLHIVGPPTTVARIAQQANRPERTTGMTEGR